MRKLEEQYQSELAVVGVEAGKFGAERVTENIRHAVLRLGVSHPVVNDRHFRIWRSYSVSAWPTIVIVDPQGYYLGAHPGEITADSFAPVLGKMVRDYDGRGLLDRRPLDFLRPETLAEPARVLSFPGKVLAAGDRRLFIADSNHNRILAVTLDENGDGGRVSEVVGSGHAGLVDGDFASAAFQRPQGLALSGEMLYVADSENHAVRAVDLRRRVVSTVAGTGEQAGRYNAAGHGRRVRLSSPWDVAIVGSTLYIARAGTHQLFRLDVEHDKLQPYAGSGREEILDDNLASSALAQPMGLATDSRYLYFADSESSAIRQAELPPGDGVRTIVGTGLFDYGDRDGEGEAVRLQHAQGVAFDHGALYVADTYNNKIKLIDPMLRRATSLFGSEVAGYRDGEHPLFHEPADVSLADGKLFIADTNNHAIRVADLRTKRVATLSLRSD